MSGMSGCVIIFGTVVLVRETIIHGPPLPKSHPHRAQILPRMRLCCKDALSGAFRGNKQVVAGFPACFPATSEKQAGKPATTNNNALKYVSFGITTLHHERR